MTQRAGLYARISEHDERVAKVSNQLKDCRKHATARQYVVAAEYVDDGISATTGKERPAFERLLRDVASGELDVIVAVDEDRMTRDLSDTMRLQALCAAASTTWDTVRGGVRDPGTADGKFFTSLKTLVSRMEVDKKVERQKAANRHRRMSGQPMTGTRPFGFEKDRVTHRPDEAKEIAGAYATVIGTGKLYPVLKDWNARGIMTSRGNAWSYATLQQLLRRGSNAGLVEHEGEILEDVAAAWEPIVSREDWQTVRAILSDPNRRIVQNREPKHLLAGLVRCGTCGSVMRSSGSTNRPGEKIYRCTTKINAQGDGRRHASVRITDLDPIVRAAVIDTFFVSSPDGLPSQAEDVAELGRLHARLSEVRQGIAELIDSVGQPGYTRARVDAAVRRLADEEAGLSEQIDAQSRRSAHAAMMVDTYALISTRTSWDDAEAHKSALADRFDSLTLEQRRTLVRSLVSVTVHGGRRLEDRIEVEHIGAPALDVDGDPDGAPWSA